MSRYKKINITKVASVLAVSALLSTTAYAGNNDSMIAFGAKVGTAGVGIEGRAPIVDNLYGRFGVNYLHYNHSLNNGALNYKGKLTLLTVPLMLDYHPFDNSGFRVSAGVAYNGNKITATAKPSKTVTLYGEDYEPGDLGTVKSKLTLGNTISPIASIGYDNSLISDSHWRYNSGPGVMYTGKAKNKVTSTGNLANEPEVINNVNRDANKSLDTVKK